MTTRIGLCGLDSSHAEDFLRHFNREERHPGIRVTSLWGGDASRVEELIAYAPGVVAVGSLDDLVSDVDLAIVGDRHGDLHLRHALPFIEAGKPVFVDKPLANSPADAEAIVAAAGRSGTPLLSGSALRWQTATQELRARMAPLGGPLKIAAYGTWYPDSGYGGAIFYAIHTVELAQELVGPGWSELTLERDENPTVRYRAANADVTLEFRPLGPSGSSDFGVTVEGRGERLHQPVPLGDDYMAPVAGEIAKMMETGRSPMSREALLAPVALMAEIDALLKA